MSIDDENVHITTMKPSSETAKPTRKLRKGQNLEEEEYFERLAQQKPKPVYISEPCDKQSTLYIMNQTKFIVEDAPQGVTQSNCSR